MEIALLPYQKQFLQSKAKYTWLKVGLGGGKTYVLAMYIIKRMLENPETLGLVAANSYNQLTNSILAELFSQLDNLGLSFSYNTLTKELVLHATGAKALCLSLEKYEQLRGVELGWLAVDELAYARLEAYNVMIGRLRCKRSHALEGRFASTPNSFNFLYDIFAAGGYISRDETQVYRSTEYHEMISATAYDNFFLPVDYLPSLEVQYSPLMLKQELNAEFVNLTEGLVYHGFNRERNLKVVENPSNDRRVGMDFNVSPMTAVVGAIIGKQSVHITSELWLMNSNTFEMADRVYDIEPGITIYPDATGAARKTSAAVTDHQILRDAGFDVKSRRKNPSVKDRYNNTNRFLANGWLTISPDCKHLINDFTKLVHENKDESLSHVSDAVGYLCWGINPLKRQQTRSRCL